MAGTQQLNNHTKILCSHWQNLKISNCKKPASGLISTLFLQHLKPCKRQSGGTTVELMWNWKNQKKNDKRKILKNGLFKPFLRTCNWQGQKDLSVCGAQNWLRIFRCYQFWPLHPHRLAVSRTASASAVRPTARSRASVLLLCSYKKIGQKGSSDSPTMCSESNLMLMSSNSMPILFAGQAQRESAGQAYLQWVNSLVCQKQLCRKSWKNLKTEASLKR